MNWGPTPDSTFTQRAALCISGVNGRPAVNAARPHPASGLCAAIAGWYRPTGVQRNLVHFWRTLPPVWSGPCVTGVQREDCLDDQPHQQELPEPAPTFWLTSPSFRNLRHTSMTSAKNFRGGCRRAVSAMRFARVMKITQDFCSGVVVIKNC
jgi:hypothetical protein